MAGSSNKKVVIQRFDREPIFGFVQQNAWLRADGIELLSPTGTLIQIALMDAKAICFVREFSLDPVPASRRAFLNRPKVDGVWVRLVFRDAEMLEGVMPNNLLYMEAAGISVIPPDSAQRVFAPRTALTAVQVLGVVGSPFRGQSKARTGKGTQEQIGLFEGSGL
ncbi:MAG: hypothetical protein H7039_18220 [Bryobacteraceae bacterium]|nr:hypothetical protein [Bryobacteraceae bacterium]